MAYQNKGGARWNLEECTHGRAPKARKFLKRGSVRVERQASKCIDLIQDDTPEYMVDPRWCNEWEKGGEAFSITNGETIITVTWPASGQGFYFETHAHGPKGYSHSEGWML